MIPLEKDYVMSVASTAWLQLIGTTPAEVICSWGISKRFATQVVKEIDGEQYAMGALVLEVDGFQLKGRVFIALDEGSDYYRIYSEIADGTTKEDRFDVAFDELGEVLDVIIERGGMNEQEYQQRVAEEYQLKTLVP